MSRKSDPRIRHHKHSNRAYVELSGYRVYLGKWDGSKNGLTQTLRA